MTPVTIEQLEEWSGWFKVLGDPTRLRILHFIAQQGDPTTVGAIVDQLGLTQSNVSHHLKNLAQQRFVRLEPDGTRTLITANPLCLAELPAAAAAIMNADRLSPHTKPTTAQPH